VVRAANVTVAAILAGLEVDREGIYSAGPPAASSQAEEQRSRDAVARRAYDDVLGEIGRHHSIPVMDREVRAFLRQIPRDGVIADIGGGWGWHWRHIRTERPDVSVVIVDFVRANLSRAAALLGDLVNEQVFLVHGDATCLPFPSSLCDGYWSVQALQHIPDFEQAVQEAHRILRPNGIFASYSLNRARMIELIYRLVGRPYHVAGKRPGSFHLSRASSWQAEVVSRVFGSAVASRYTEILFHPDLRLSTGGETSRIARVDAVLSNRTPLLAPIARQRSYHARKAC
jgi:ubiquinone/menaquinone biosynthesis C-methylase UbiE